MFYRYLNDILYFAKIFHLCNDFDFVVRLNPSQHVGTWVKSSIPLTPIPIACAYVTGTWAENIFPLNLVFFAQQ